MEAWDQMLISGHLAQAQAPSFSLPGPPPPAQPWLHRWAQDTLASVGRMQGRGPAQQRLCVAALRLGGECGVAA